MEKLSVERLQKELTAGREHKRARVSAFWRPNDAAYVGDVIKYSKLPFNFAMPILSGYEDTLVSKIDEAPSVRFGSNQPGEARLGKQLDSLWRSQSDRAECDYAMSDLTAKRHACRYGRAFLKVVGYKKPFKIDVYAVDPYDMVVDPNGGGDLEDHRFVIQDGIFRTAKELEDGAASGRYDKEAVARILAGPADKIEEYKIESDSFGRWNSLTQSGYGYDCAGETVYRLCEHVTMLKGVKRMVVWSPESKTVLKDQTLMEAYGCDLLPWVSWAPYEDNKVFWSKAPDDDIRQVAEAMRVTVMEMMTNVQKQNWGTKVIDPSRISAEDIVRYSPNGVVIAKPGASEMSGGLDAAFKMIETPRVDLAMSVVEFLDRFVGQKTGVTPDAQGTSSEDTLGVYMGNLQQVADRMGLTSRFYKHAWRRIAVRFLYQVKRNLTGKLAVETIGAKGNEMTYLMARNVNPELGVTITGGSAEAAVSQVKRRERADAVNELFKSEFTAQMVNMEAAVSERLKSAGFEEDEIRLLLNKDAGTEYRDQQLRAQEKVEELLEGEKPSLYYGADTTFVKTILQSAETFTDHEGPEYERLVAFARAHIKIAAQNAAFKAAENSMLQLGMPQEEAPEQPMEAPMPQMGGMPQEMQVPSPEMINQPTAL